MEKPKLNYFVDALLLLCILIAAVTGIIKLPLLINTFSLARVLPWKTINFVHDWTGVVLAALILLHIVLHWKWIIAMTKQVFKK